MPDRRQVAWDGWPETDAGAEGKERIMLAGEERETVSVIVPAFNRAHLLANALASIRDQTYESWELIVVDDGSTDNTRELAVNFAKEVHQKVKYIFQNNQGPAAARRNGIEHSDSNFIAFLDSDDRWLPFHLENCMKYLKKYRDVDWVCADMARVQLRTGAIVQSSKFHDVGGCPRFFELANEQREDLHVIADKRVVIFLIKYGTFGSLQCSVFNKRIFSVISLRNFRMGEDRLFALEAALNGCRLAYLDRVQVHFGVHGDHSTVVEGASAERCITIYSELLRCYHHMMSLPGITWSGKLALRMAASNECFWNLAYSGLWKNKEYEMALKYFVTAIKIYPFSASYWKNIFIFVLKYLFRRVTG